VRAWLYGIATNLIRRHRRDEERMYRAFRRVDASDRARAKDGDERIVARVVAQGVQRELAVALRSLKPGDRDVLLLVALAELSGARSGGHDVARFITPVTSLSGTPLTTGRRIVELQRRSVVDHRALRLEVVEVARFGLAGSAAAWFASALSGGSSWMPAAAPPAK